MQRLAVNRDQLFFSVGEQDPQQEFPLASGMTDPDLGPAAAARLDTWCRVYKIPPSTMGALRAQGKGPRVFEVGRLLFWYARGLGRLVGQGLATGLAVPVLCPRQPAASDAQPGARLRLPRDDATG